MNLKTDGVFTIEKGQGITQGIINELGLNAEQAKKIDKSVWDAILAEVAKQKDISPELYSGGSDINGKPNSNFVVQTVTVSLKNVWNKILNIINTTLNTNFENTDDNIYLDDPDGSLLDRLDKINEDARKTRKEISSRYEPGAWYSEEDRNAYNNAGKKELLELLGVPEKEGQYLIIRDSEGNTVKQYKAIATDDKLGWISY